MKHLAAPALVTLLLISSCGEEPTSEADPPAASSSPSPTPTEEQPPTIDDPEAHLLTLEDLPDGFTVESSTAEGAPSVGADEEVDVISGVEACARLFDYDSDLHETAVSEYAAVGFAGGEFGPFLEHAINVYPSGESLDDEFALYEGILEDCDGESVTVADSEGFQLAMDLSRVDFPDLGDRTSALAMSGVLVEYDVAVETVFVLVQAGDTTSSFSATGMAGETYSDQAFEDLVSLAVDRLEDAL